MKKNEHYFPSMEWVKVAEECGWRRVIYKGGQVIEDKGPDGVMASGGSCDTP